MGLLFSHLVLNLPAFASRAQKPIALRTIKMRLRWGRKAPERQQSRCRWVIQMVHLSEGSWWRGAPGLKPTGPTLGKQR